MLVKQLAFAASATAFLIHPKLSEADEGIFRALPIESSGEPFELPPVALKQSIEVPCRKCQGKDAHLKMDFSVEDATRLMLNGFELYPSADPWHGDLMASVVRGNGDKSEDRLGYSLAVRPEGTDKEQKLEVVAVELRVIEVGHRFVSGVPPVKVKLVKAPGGDIVIGSVDILGRVGESGDECLTIWCRVHDMMDEAWKEVKGHKGCAGQSTKDRPHHGHGSVQGIKRPEGFRQGGEIIHDKPKHGHHSRPKPHGATRFLEAFTYIFAPVLLGITAGAGAALLFMFITTMVCRVSRFLCGRRAEASQGACYKASEAESHVDEEKAGLMVAEDDLPPQYEDEEPRK